MRVLRAVCRWLGTRCAGSDFSGNTYVPFDCGLGEY